MLRETLFFERVVESSRFVTMSVGTELLNRHVLPVLPRQACRVHLQGRGNELLELGLFLLLGFRSIWAGQSHPPAIVEP